MTVWIYLEVAPQNSTDMQSRFKAVIKQYAKDDPLRKKAPEVHVHLSKDHAQNKPLREWGTNAEERLLAMAFPALFPFGITSFRERHRTIPWHEGDFGDWLRHLPFIHYTVGRSTVP
jgi:hypothetical protein